MFQWTGDTENAPVFTISEAVSAHVLRATGRMHLPLTGSGWSGHSISPFSHTVNVPPSPVLSKPLEVLPASLQEQRLGQGPASPTAAAVGEWEELWLSLSRNCTPSSCRSSLCWVMSDCSWAIWVAFASWIAIPGLLREKRAGQAGVLYWPDLAHWLAVNIEVSECSSCSDQRVLWSGILSLAAAGDRCVRKATRTGKGIAMHSW